MLSPFRITRKIVNARVHNLICDEKMRLYVEMNFGKPLLDIETWTLLVNAREISVA